MQVAAVLGIVFSVILMRYISTLSPNIAGGDSGELVAEGCVFGTPHPPGYPLFMVLTNALSLIHESYNEFNVAYLCNMSSAVLTAAAAILIALVVKTFTNSHIPSMIFAAGMFAFSPLIWQYAVTAEVFPLNTFFASLLLFTTIQFASSKKLHLVIVGAFLCGLALCNQHTAVLFEVPLILYITFLIRRVLYEKPVYLLYLGVAFFAGLIPYGILPYVAHTKPNSGSWGDVSSLDGFLHHFLRKDYGTFQLFSGNRGDTDIEGFVERTEAYLDDIQFTQGLYIIPCLVLIALGGCLVDYSALLSSYRAAAKVSHPTGSKFDSTNSAVSSTPTKGKAKPKHNFVYDSKTARAAPASTPQKETGSTDTSVSAVTTIVASGLSSSSSPLISSTEVAFTLPWLLPLTQLFYFGVFHSLSNLPLSNKLLYGVHQRFWMQPNLITFAYGGIGFYYFVRLLEYLCSCVCGNSSSGSFSVNNSKSKESVKDSKQRNKQEEDAKDSNNTGAALSLWHLIQVLVAVALVYLQHQSQLFRSNQSEGDHFNRYARALLSPLPINSILIINYDQQWTSVRYLQNCEGFRTDVTTINLSMMSYEWFQEKQKLLTAQQGIKFPGDRYGRQSGKAVSKTRHRLIDQLMGVPAPADHYVTMYTISDFVQANIHDRNVFIGGKLSYPDDRLTEEFDSVPFGLVTEFISRSAVKFGHKNIIPTSLQYVQRTLISWRKVFEMLPELPYLDKYDEETWEWTIGRDWKDRLNGEWNMRGVCVCSVCVW